MWISWVEDKGQGPGWEESGEEKLRPAEWEEKGVAEGGRVQAVWELWHVVRGRSGSVRSGESAVQVRRTWAQRKDNYLEQETLVLSDE